jgi:hypothetical protein
MKNDSTMTFLNLVLGALALLGVMFAIMTILSTHRIRQIQPHVQMQAQIFQNDFVRVQALVADSMTYNATANNPELNQIIQSLRNPAPAGK